MTDLTATTLRTLLVKAEALIHSTEQARDQYHVDHRGESARVSMNTVTAADRAASLYDYVAGLAKAAGINPDTAEQDLAALAEFPPADAYQRGPGYRGC